MLLKFSWVKVGSHSIMKRYQEALSLILSTRNIAKNATANCGMWEITNNFSIFVCSADRLYIAITRFITIRLMMKIAIAKKAPRMASLS